MCVGLPSSPLVYCLIRKVRLDVAQEACSIHEVNVMDNSRDNFLSQFVALCVDDSSSHHLSSVSSVVADTYIGLEPWQTKGVGVAIMEQHMKVIDEFDEYDVNGRLIHTIVIEHIVGLPLEELHINVKQEYKYEDNKPRGNDS